MEASSREMALGEAKFCGRGRGIPCRLPLSGPEWRLGLPILGRLSREFVVVVVVVAAMTVGVEVGVVDAVALTVEVTFVDLA